MNFKRPSAEKAAAKPREQTTFLPASVSLVYGFESFDQFNAGNIKLLKK
jgi:hypothetical protein